MTSDRATPMTRAPKAVLTGKPAWLKARIPGGEAYSTVRATVKEHGLHTVCQSASCPNLGECWSKGTATFMILGNVCTRGCRFCDVPKGRPGGYDREEPARVAESVRLMGLRYAVITSVTRDDLPDQGAEVWAETIREARKAAPACKLEVLIPDMQARMDLLDVILAAGPDILNHNFETVARLQKPVRGRGNIADSTAVLTHAKAAGFTTKTSLMLGLGETPEEVREMISYVASLKVDILTLGQYLQPSRDHLPVSRFVPPEEFAAFRDHALGDGIRICVSGPMVRSSYNADQQSAPLHAPAAPRT
ncbi:MAG TPA: lipoyl synthase [Fibrobacteria bacterium]|nr:lipoyl synthase [Fibrobacteria bacterium]